MLEIRGIWLCHMSRWDRYVLRPRIWMETSRSGTVSHIGPIYPPSRENSRSRNLFLELASVPPPPRFQDREHQKTYSWHPAGGRIDLRESPLHHGCSPDVP